MPAKKSIRAKRKPRGSPKRSPKRVPKKVPRGSPRGSPKKLERCPNGSRRNKVTGKCVKVKPRKSPTKVRFQFEVSTPTNPASWKKLFKQREWFIIGKDWCGACKGAMESFKKYGVQFNHTYSLENEQLPDLVPGWPKDGYEYWPVILRNGKFFGGNDTLQEVIKKENW